VTPPRLREGFRHSLLVFLAVRVGASVIGLVGVTLIQPRSGDLPVVPGWTIAQLSAGWHNLFTSLERQDAAWYLSIATHGYSHADTSAAFFPLYPLAIRVVAWLPGVGPLAAAIVVSNLAFLGALVMLHGLSRLEGMSEEAARLTTLYIAIFPTAFFFLAPYSESLFLLLSVAAFWFARRDKWALAALLGALAALTRSLGVLLIPALALEALWMSRKDRGYLRRLAGAAGVALGPLAYFLYCQIRFGDFWAPLHAQKLWQRDAVWPWVTVWRAVVDAGRFGTYWAVDLLVVGVVVIAVCAGVRWLRPSYLVYSVAGLLLPLSYWASFRPLLSMPRFVIVIFPAFWVLARATERRKVPGSLVTGCFAAGYGVLCLLFVNWWHIF
jgi:hypothetical protein